MPLGLIKYFLWSMNSIKIPLKYTFYINYRAYIFVNKLENYEFLWNVSGTGDQSSADRRWSGARLVDGALILTPGSWASAVLWLARWPLFVTLELCFSPICQWKTTWPGPLVTASVNFVSWKAAFIRLFNDASISKMICWKAASNLCLSRQRERQSKPSSHRKSIAATVCSSTGLPAVCA